VGRGQLGGYHAASRATFVGRQAELNALHASVEQALDGHGRLVLLTGEAGIGKTRTAEELAAYAQRRGAQVLWGRCSEDAGAPAFWPWVQLLRSCTNPLDPEALRRLLGDGAPEIAQLVPQVRERLPGLPIPSGLDSAQARFRLFDAVARVLEQLARRMPLVLIIDDLHGADQSSLLLLQFVVRALREWPLLLVGAYRDPTSTREHPLTALFVEALRQPGTQQLTLSGLSPSEVERFIELTAGVKPAAAVVAAIHQQTEGNPLFVAEYLRLLLTDPSQSGLHTLPATLGVPQSVKAVIGRRLRPLSRECNAVLEAASVIGREFGLDVVEWAVASLPALSLSLRERGLGDLLAEAVTAGVLVEVPGPAHRYRFAHALFHETLYDELSPARRMHLHREVGAAIERLPDIEEHLTELAHHFFEAADENAAQAVHYAQRAGERARALLAYEEAARLYELGLDALRRVPTAATHAGEDRHERQRCELLLGFGEAQNGAGKTLQSKETVLRAADIARRLGLREHVSRAALAFGVQFAWGEAGVTDTTLIGLLEEAIALWGAEDSALHARLLGRLATALTYTPSAARRTAFCGEGVAMARRIGDPATLACALDAQHSAAWGPGNQVERVAIATELAQLAEQAHDRHLAFQAHFWRANDYLELGDFDAFDADLNTCTRLAEELRRPYYAFHVSLFQAARALILGRFEDARRFATAVYTEGMKWHERAAEFGAGLFALNTALLGGEPLDGFVVFLETAIAQHPEVPNIRCIVAHLYAELNREADAGRELNYVAAADFVDWPQDAILIHTLTLLSDTCAFLGDTERAALLYELLAPYAARAAVVPNVGVYSGCVSQSLGTLAATMSRWDDAVRHFADAVAFNTRMRARPQLALTQHTYARVLLARAQPGDRELASRLLATALDTARELGMKRLEAKVSDLLSTRPAIGEAQRRSARQPESRDAQRETGIFRKDGDLWEIAYAGRTGRLEHTRGLQYIAHLLRYPGREIDVLELVQGSGVGGQGREDQTSSTGDRGLPLLDAQAKAEYRQRVHAWRAELQESERLNDRGAIERARAEIEMLSDQLAGAVDLGGRDRPVGAGVERARVAVSKRIKEAIDRIRAVHAPLAEHLKASISTGYYCTYTPIGPTPTWCL
jgi:tetratricopeptide (TPR) repeat protein